MLLIAYEGGSMYNSDYWIALGSLALATLILALLPGDNSLARERDRARLDDNTSPPPPGDVADGVDATNPGQPGRRRTSSRRARAGRAASATTPRLRVGRLLSILMGQDGRLSTSKTFGFLWTLVIAYMIITIVSILARHSVPGGPAALLTNLDPVYWLLLGGPFASLVIAKRIVTQKVAKGTLVKPQADAVPRLSDITADDAGRVDLVDFQYGLFNLIAMGFVLSQFVIHQDGVIPVVPNLFALLTLGPSAVYLTNKAATGNTPILDTLSPTVARIGQQVTLYGTNLLPAGSGSCRVTVYGIPCPVRRARGTAVTFEVATGLADLVPASGSTAELHVELVTADVSVRCPTGLTLVSDRPVITGFAEAYAEGLHSPVTVVGRFFLPAEVTESTKLATATTPSASGPFVYAQLPGQTDYDRCEISGTIRDNQIGFSLPGGWVPAPTPPRIAVNVLVRRDGMESNSCALQVRLAGAGRHVPASPDGAVGAPV